MARKLREEVNTGAVKRQICSYKPAKAKQLAVVFTKLQQLLVAEWPNVKNANLGVKSGTNIIDDVLLLQLQQLALQLHTLAISDAEAGRVLVRMVAKMSQQHWQQLQVLLDILGHEELSDYLALLAPQATAKQHCSCKDHGTAKAAGMSGSCAPHSRCGALTAGRERCANSSGTGQPQPDGSGITDRSWPEQQLATGVSSQVMDLTADGREGMPDNRHRRQAVGYTSLPDLDSLRFASLLPPGHILTKTAEELRREHEFEAALAASKASKAAAAAKQAHHQAVIPLLNLPTSKYNRQSGSSGSCGGYFLNANSRPTSASTPVSPFKWADEDQALGTSQPGFRMLQQRHNNRSNITWGVEVRQVAGEVESPLTLSYFRAPVKSVEQLWKEGRAAVTETVLGQAHIEVRERPMNVLILEPAYITQPRVARAASPPLLDINAVGTAAAGGAGNSVRPGNSRRGSVTSRPCSARQASRMSSCGIQLAAENVAVSAAVASGGPLTAFGSAIATPSAGSNGSSSNLAVTSSSTADVGQLGRRETAAADCSSTGCRSPAAAPPVGTSAAAPSRRAAIGPNSLGLCLKQGGLGSKLLDGGDAGNSNSAAGVPGLQLSRLGSMHAPGMLQGAGVNSVRPGSAASTARSRPDSAATSNLSRPMSALGQPS